MEQIRRNTLYRRALYLISAYDHHEMSAEEFEANWKRLGERVQHEIVFA